MKPYQVKLFVLLFPLLIVYLFARFAGAIAYFDFLIYFFLLVYFIARLIYCNYDLPDHRPFTGALYGFGVVLIHFPLSAGLLILGFDIKDLGYFGQTMLQIYALMFAAQLAADLLALRMIKRMG